MPAGNVIVIGSGIAGMTCAVHLAEAGVHVLLVSPFPSEQSQSVMAAGGINAVLSGNQTEDGSDSVAVHIEDTLRGGCDLAGARAVSGLCEGAEEIIRFLERIGTVFTVDEDGRPARRAFGGQSFRRTCFCGTSTGKQIVSALAMEVRRHEAAGRITRRLWSCFHSALIRDGVCRGVLLFDEGTRAISAETADAVVIATGGQNTLFGKTTGSTQCDGYTAGMLFLQGVDLKNLEFIQFHPTTLETSQKRMLISEAVRGEGGRLFTLRGKEQDPSAKKDERFYFMEEKYGPGGNLMTRDVVSQEIWRIGGEAYLDISSLKKTEIDRRLPEVRDLCRKYRGIDITREPIPVTPAVHFFMGGLAVHLNHETKVKNLFAIGECAAMYHGANRLGGNSLLAALHSARVAAGEIHARLSAGEPASGAGAGDAPDFGREAAQANADLQRRMSTTSAFPVMYIRDMLAETMRKHMGIVRTEASIDRGIADVEYYLEVAEKISYDSSVLPYELYSLKGILTLAKAALTCAKERRESRGAHYREDYPDMREACQAATIISYDEGGFRVWFDKERAYEN